MRKVVKKKINLKANVKTFVITSCVLIVALLLVHIRVLTDNLKYENMKKGSEEKQLLKDNENFKRELESLKSPSKIEKEAIRFGMSYPKNWQVREIQYKKND